MFELITDILSWFGEAFLMIFVIPIAAVLLWVAKLLGYSGENAALPVFFVAFTLAVLGLFVLVFAIICYRSRNKQVDK